MPAEDPRLAALRALPTRERKHRILALLRAAGPEDLEALAPLLREPSPRVAARVTALLARHGRRDLLEAALPGLKPGKIALLEATYERIAGRPGRRGAP